MLPYWPPAGLLMTDLVPPAPLSTPSPVSASPRSNGVASVAQMLDMPDLRAPNLYLNRELSWLEFNARVLAEAENEAVPLLERLKFHAIVASNLDEFFMVRVAGPEAAAHGRGRRDAPRPDDHRRAAHGDLAARARARRPAGERPDRQPPAEARSTQGIRLVKPESLSADAQAALDQRFKNEIFPILTPIAIDPGHPFPHLRNKSLNLGVMFQRDGALEVGFGVVQVPMMLPRLFEVLGVKGADGALARHTFVLLEDLIARQRRDDLPGGAPEGRLRLPRHAQLRPRDRRGGGGGPPADDPAGAPAPRARQRRAARGRPASRRPPRSRSSSRR